MSHSPVTARFDAVRRIGLPLIVIALLSSACTIRFNTDVVLTGEDTATVTLVVGIRFEEGAPPDASEGMDELDPAAAEADTQAIAEQCGFSADAVSAEEYAEDDFTGATIVLTDVPIASVGCFLADQEDSPFESFSITRDGDDYVFNAQVAALGEDLEGLGGQKVQVAQEGTEDPFGDLEEGLEDVFGSGGVQLEGRVTITFPGPIREHNADTVDGNTATWNLSLESATTMMAVGAATEGGGGLPLVPIIIVIVVVVLLVILLLVLRGRGKKGAAGAFAGPPGSGGFAPGAPQGGFGGPPGQPGQPGGFGGPPGAPGGSAPQQGGYGAPPGAPAGGPPGQPGGYGQPPGPGGFGGPPGAPGGSAPQQGGFGGPPGQQPPPSAPGQPQPPQQPGPPAGEGGPPGGGFDAGSTRTFRPEDLLPPGDQDKR